MDLMDGRKASGSPPSQDPQSDPHRPINPPDAVSTDRFELPAYISNGLIGLKVVEAPLGGGVAMLNGFVGEHPEEKIEAAARTPFPLSGDLSIDGVRMSQSPHLATATRQSHDFSSGELTTRGGFRTASARAEIEVLMFCSRRRPTLVCQEIRVTVDAACKLRLSAGLDGRGVYGREDGLLADKARLEKAEIDGALRWASHGGLAAAGLAFVTEFLGDEKAERIPDAHEQLLESAYEFDAEPGRTYRLRQITSVVSDGEHHQPELQAARLAAMARRDGFDALRQENRDEWAELWKSRVRLVGAEPRWQALADAAWYYLNASTHSSALASTSIFGLAAWPDYHYYYGHVMWDIETFVVPPVTLLQPHAAVALLNYRYAHRKGARANAALFGRRGLQYPWESGRSTGHEAAPLPGSASWREDHVSLDVAHAFAVYSDLTGDERFRREKAAPVLAGVADWLVSRARRTQRGFEIPRAMGVAERKEPSDNPAFVNLSAKVVLREAVRICGDAGLPVDPAWTEIAERLVLPMDGNAVVSHDGYAPDEEKGETPDPLMGIFPLDGGLSADQAQATLELYLARADEYAGSPMLSALLGVWASWCGDRDRALQLLDAGYGQFEHGRFGQILEYRPDRSDGQPLAGPFFANIGGFALGLMLGFPGLIPDGGDPERWARRDAVLPAGWEAIEIDRIWVRGQPMRLIARHGERARLEPADGS
ncbi:glycoside hydrolase family 65 protein [Phenylobacterium sp.]|uniref:glycoside hydrolase family 65 protein n=1 Tax=Phenylobacterium sp. TaxID=1871053 RepID=UPI0025D7B1D1|nr:glycoside hydrolase family 65 protein [Phenylobacterium sp.]